MRRVSAAAALVPAVLIVVATRTSAWPASTRTVTPKTLSAGDLDQPRPVLARAAGIAERSSPGSPPNVEELPGAKQTGGKGSVTAAAHLHGRSSPLVIWYWVLAVFSALVACLATFGTRAERRRRDSERQLRTLAEAVTNTRLQETTSSVTVRDPVTRLFTECYMEESLKREIHRAERENSPLALIVLEISGFDRMVETLGRDAQEALLRGVGDILQPRIRASDAACRSADNRFVLLLPQIWLPHALKRAEQMRSAIEDLILRLSHQCEKPDAPGVRLAVNIGVVAYPDHGLTRDALVGAATTELLRDRAANASVLPASVAGGIPNNPDTTLVQIWS